MPAITFAPDYFSRGCGRCERFDTPHCASQVWQDGLLALRQICLDAGLVETLKWSHPCYVHAGRNIAILGALRGDFRISFFNPALLDDPEGLLERGGPNTQHPGMMRFRDAAEVRRQAGAIRGFLRQAIAHALAGRQAPKEVRSLDLPAELADSLARDAELAQAFARLTPGRQRSYVLHLGSAKKAQTRIERLARLRGHILAGKGAFESLEGQ